MKEDVKKKIKGIAGWTIGIAEIIAGIWILAGGNAPNNLSETNLKDNVSQSHTANYISVKYRSDKVDIANPRFEYLDTSESSWVRGAWYDDDNGYMVINLSGTYYHYCSMPESAWNSFKSASSFGTFYNQSIKGNYDCRVYPVPKYE